MVLEKKKSEGGLIYDSSRSWVEQVACFVKMMDISFWSLYISDLPTLTWVCPVALYVLK